MFEAGPSVHVEGAEDEPIKLVIKYHSRAVPRGAVPAYGLITFTDVKEYRFVASFFGYEDHAGHERDFRFGLIEITDSAYVENMASKGARRRHAGQRFGEVIQESEVKHYRLAFDEYGRFDVIALGVTVSEVAG